MFVNSWRVVGKRARREGLPHVRHPAGAGSARAIHLP